MSSCHMTVDDKDDDVPISADFVDETTHIKLWLHKVALNYSSELHHRLDRVLHALAQHNYEPYSEHQPGKCNPG